VFYRYADIAGRRLVVMGRWHVDFSTRMKLRSRARLSRHIDHSDAQFCCLLLSLDFDSHARLLANMIQLGMVF
jgi:hypothetical protein